MISEVFRGEHSEDVETAGHPADTFQAEKVLNLLISHHKYHARRLFQFYVQILFNLKVKRGKGTYKC